MLVEELAEELAEALDKFNFFVQQCEKMYICIEINIKT